MDHHLVDVGMLIASEWSNDCYKYNHHPKSRPFRQPKHHYWMPSSSVKGLQISRLKIDFKGLGAPPRPSKFQNMRRFLSPVLSPPPVARGLLSPPPGVSGPPYPPPPSASGAPKILSSGAAH